MIKFISSYIELGFGFMFKECPHCGNISIMIVKEGKLDNINGLITSKTCVKRELFENEDKLISELSGEMSNILKADES